MFEWLKWRRPAKALDEATRAYVLPETFRPIRTALSTIGADVRSAETETFVAECAARISKHLCEASRLNLSKDEALYVAGIFAMVAANHLSRKLHARFEVSASLALARLVAGHRDIGPIQDTAIDGFYRLTTSKATIIQGIAESLGNWIDHPIPENLECLTTKFDVLRSTVAKR
jgi:hypothetical protein